MGDARRFIVCSNIYIIRVLYTCVYYLCTMYVLYNKSKFERRKIFCDEICSKKTVTAYSHNFRNNVSVLCHDAGSGK